MNTASIRASAKNLDGIATRLGKTADRLGSGHITEDDHKTIGVVRSLQTQASNRLVVTAGDSVGGFNKLVDERISDVKRGIEEGGTQLKGGIWSTLDLRRPRMGEGAETINGVKRDALDGARALRSWADRIDRREALTGSPAPRSFETLHGIRSSYESALKEPALSRFDRELLKQDIADITRFLDENEPKKVNYDAAIKAIEEAGADAGNIREHVAPGSSHRSKSDAALKRLTGLFSGLRDDAAKGANGSGNAETAAPGTFPRGNRGGGPLKMLPVSDPRVQDFINGIPQRNGGQGGMNLTVKPVISNGQLVAVIDDATGNVTRMTDIWIAPDGTPRDISHLPVNKRSAKEIEEAMREPAAAEAKLAAQEAPTTVTTADGTVHDVSNLPEILRKPSSIERMDRNDAVSRAHFEQVMRTEPLRSAKAEGSAEPAPQAAASSTPRSAEAAAKADAAFERVAREVADEAKEPQVRLIMGAVRNKARREQQAATTPAAAPQAAAVAAKVVDEMPADVLQRLRANPIGQVDRKLGADVEFRASNPVGRAAGYADAAQAERDAIGWTSGGNTPRVAEFDIEGTRYLTDTSVRTPVFEATKPFTSGAISRERGLILEHDDVRSVYAGGKKIASKE